jgi:dTDP-4-dehydrorhamnose 3,5-epimerase-like enzyme
MTSLHWITLPQNFSVDQRGWSFAPFKNLEIIQKAQVDWNSFHAVSLEPGIVRGNHYHPETTEWLFFCGGPVRLVWQEVGALTTQEALIENNYTLVIIPPGISHAVKNESPGITYLIAFRSPAVSGENPEVIRSVLISHATPVA